MDNKIYQRLGWYGLLFAIVFILYVTISNQILTNKSEWIVLKEVKSWANTDEWQAIEQAGLDHCTLWANTSYVKNLRIGTKSAISLTTSMMCSADRESDEDAQFLLRLQGPMDNIQPIGEIRTSSKDTTWTITGTNSKGWQGTLRIDLLAGDQQISILAMPIEIQFVRFLGLDQTGIIIVTVLLFIGAMACLMVAEWRKKIPAKNQ